MAVLTVFYLIKYSKLINTHCCSNLLSTVMLKRKSCLWRNSSIRLVHVKVTDKSSASVVILTCSIRYTLHTSNSIHSFYNTKYIS